jgi:hypothetical protein
MPTKETHMPSHCARVLGVVIAASTFAFAAGSTAAAAPTTQPQRTPRCTAGVTYKILTPTVARTRTVNVRSANIRRGPGTDCPLITSVGRGFRMNGTGRIARNGKSVWLEVKGKFGTGWVANSLVR